MTTTARRGIGWAGFFHARRIFVYRVRIIWCRRAVVHRVVKEPNPCSGLPPAIEAALGLLCFAIGACVMRRVFLEGGGELS